MDDQGGQWALRVNPNNFADLARGWFEVTLPAPPRLSQGWFTRKVTGLDDDGRRQQAVVPHTGAPIWTGETKEFTVIGLDQLPHTCHVIEYMGEKQRGRAAPEVPQTE